MQTHRRKLALFTALAGFAIGFTITGCGGGKDDPTRVALKPSRAPEGNGGGTAAKTGGGGNAGGPVATDGYGGITGRIVLAAGEAVPEPKVKIVQGAAPANPEFCAKDMPILDESLVVNAENRGVKDVFVYLTENPDNGKVSEANEKTWGTVFDQKNCTFEPHCMVAKVGKEVIVKTQDPVPHNVHNHPSDNAEFNNVINPTNKEGLPLTYTSAELKPVGVTCDFHKWMQAYQLVVDHSYAAVTDKDGRFTIKDLPAGPHEFRIWHEGKFLSRGQEFIVEKDKDTDVGEVSFTLSQLR